MRAHRVISADELANAIAARLAPGRADSPIVWTHLGSETLVHVDTLAVRLYAGGVHITVDLETVEVDRSALGVTLALAGPGESPDLLAVTGRMSHGDSELAVRWGGVLEEAVWCAIVDEARDRLSHDSPCLLVDTDALHMYGAEPSEDT